MDSNKVDLIMTNISEKIPTESFMLVRERLLQADDSRAGMIQCIPLKDPTTAIILSILLGGYGIDRFYIGDSAMGALKLLTCGGIGIWVIVDWFIIMNKTKEKNLQKLLMLI